ncbi:MAG: helix-turn-helix transcriptional regulator [Opitutaceae bacterium]|nr:helix-turn-helix transcriptional regulator [Opitutaceae bacterium]
MENDPEVSSKVIRPVEVSIPPVGVIFAESIHEEGFRMQKRRDSFHKLLYVQNGRVNHQADNIDKKIVVERGSLLTVCSGVEHLISDLVPSTILLLCCSEAFIENDSELSAVWEALNKEGKESIPLTMADRRHFEHTWRRAMVEQLNPRVGSLVLLRSDTERMLVRLARALKEVPSRKAIRRVEEVVKNLEESFFEEWDIGRASTQAGLSRRHFSQLFKIVEGITFLEKLTELRLAYAARLLEKETHTIIGVAFSCGYNDLSHFYRLFRRRFGVPPGEWTAKKDK